MVEAAIVLMRSTRSSHRLKHRCFVEAERAAPLGMELLEAIQYPSEPVDLDQPARCPPCDSNIMRDGEIWREMVQARKRAGLRPRRRVQHSPRQKYLLTERAVEAIVE